MAVFSHLHRWRLQEFDVTRGEMLHRCYFCRAGIQLIITKSVDTAENFEITYVTQVYYLPFESGKPARSIRRSEDRRLNSRGLETEYVAFQFNRHEEEFSKHRDGQEVTIRLKLSGVKIK